MEITNINTIHEFKTIIQLPKDFPSLNDFVIWADSHRNIMISAFNHLVFVKKRYKKILKEINFLSDRTFISCIQLENLFSFIEININRLIALLVEKNTVEKNKNLLFILKKQEFKSILKMLIT